MNRSTAFTQGGLALLAATALTGSVLADTLTHPGNNSRRARRSRYVMVTGSLIPQRVEIKSIGTATTDNLRVIGRREIDQSGRFTSAGVIALDPSVTINGR
ncbi:MAG: hypothetical protein ABI871_07325 [Chthoniobacterales bacterium]